MLSLTTGYVSPQFHVKYDDAFDTVRGKSKWIISKWQELAGFNTTVGKLKRTKGSIMNSIVIPLSEYTDQQYDMKDAYEQEELGPQGELVDESDAESEADEQETEEVVGVIDKNNEKQITTRSGRILSRQPRRFNEMSCVH